MAAHFSPRSLRAASAVLIVICLCATFHLLADQSSFNSFYHPQSDVTSKESRPTSLTLQRKLDVLFETEPTKTTIELETDDEAPVKKDGFLVWSRKCMIKDMDPFDKSIKTFLVPAKKIECSKLPPLTYTTRVDGEQVLRVNEGVAAMYHTNVTHLKCCVSVITSTSENANKVSPCKDFSHERRLKLPEEYLLVRCRNTTTGRSVYTDMHAVVPNKNPPPASTSSTPINPLYRPSVLLIAIDSMSRLNMLRTMPRTLTHLRTNHWLEMRGYNKIGDNTFPNLMAVLTGSNQEKLKSSGCWADSKTFDHCNFIWKDFQKAGYITAYAEDEPYIGTFNYHKGGFKNPPTHHYFRPFMIGAFKQLLIKRRDGLAVCLGPTSTTDHFLRFATDLTETYKKSPFFALIWLNNFSHNNHNTPSTMDKRFETFFQDLLASGALNTTIVVFFSDHGARFGKIRKTLVGWNEERLPTMNLWVPTIFKTKYPNYYKSLQENGDRLTSPFDFHLTLKNILSLETVGVTNNGSSGCPTCASLFTPIPNNRECKDAGVDSFWCSCGEQTTLTTNSSIIQNAALSLVSEINSRLTRAGNVTKKCAKLTLGNILDVRVRSNGNDTQPLFDDYIIVLKTSPGNAEFDASVRHWHQKKTKKFTVSFVSRINAYGSDGYCVKNYLLKLYCHCVL